MRVTVVAVFVAVAVGQFFNGNHAPIELPAAYVLELDRGVANIEVIFQNVVELHQNTGAR